VVVYTANLSGANEVPANVSPGTGHAEVDFDIVAHTMRVQVTFSGLTAGSTASHIHSAALPGANALVATQLPTFMNFPLNVTAGSYDMTFDTSLDSTWNPAFITAHGGTVGAAEAFFASSLDAGTAYLNIHTSAFPGGEIRGQLQAVPEPSSLALLGAGCAGLAGWLRRRRS
jgi:hypothetical protein